MNKEWLIEKHTPYVRHSLAKLGCHGEDLEDVLAHARMKAWTGEFDERSSFATWFCKIAMNQWFDVRRKQRRTPFVYDLDPNHGEEHDWGLVGSEVQAALKRANDSELSVVQALVDNPDQASAAKQLGMTKATFKSILYRYRCKLTEPVSQIE